MANSTSGAAAAKLFWGMTHLNENLLCAIDIRTSGPSTETDGILEITVLPLDKMLEPHGKFMLFNMMCKPYPGEELDLRHADLSKERAADLMIRGLVRDKIAGLFADWYQTLGLKSTKRIIPLSYNWPYESMFIKTWLGELTFNEFFHYQYRDVLSIGSFFNDRAGVAESPLPHAKLDFAYLTKIYHVEHFDRKSSTNNALVLSKLYKQMLIHANAFAF